MYFLFPKVRCFLTCKLVAGMFYLPGLFDATSTYGFYSVFLTSTYTTTSLFLDSTFFIFAKNIYASKSLIELYTS
jgi:hypothetical protein